MFTTEQLSQMFRTGTLNGIDVRRSNVIREIKPRAQFDKVTVCVNGEKYMITRIFPFEENKMETLLSTDLVPRIIVHYEIEKL